MSEQPKEVEKLFGDWWVYRYNLSREVLRDSETKLTIGAPPTREEGDDEFTCLATFRLTEFDDPVRVVMDRDAKSGAWSGEDQSFDFRWAHVKHGECEMLTGYASDRREAGCYDTFVAVRSRRTVALATEPAELTHEFHASYITPLTRSRPSDTREGILSVKLRGNKFEFDGVVYNKNVEYSNYKGGRKLTGERRGPGKSIKRVGLWILPNDGSGRLLATGYHYHKPPNGVPSRPGQQECNIAIHTC